MEVALIKILIVVAISATWRYAKRRFDIQGPDRDYSHLK